MKTISKNRSEEQEMPEQRHSHYCRNCRQFWFCDLPMAHCAGPDELSCTPCNQLPPDSPSITID